MRSLGDSPPRSFEFEVLDGNDLPHSWLGRKVGVETVAAPGLLVGWLQSKSTWRLVVVEDRTGEPWCVPWVAVEAIFLCKEEPDAPGPPETAADEQQGRGGPLPDAGGPQEAPEQPFTEEPERRSWWRRLLQG
jgi:hypothetical protein